MNFSIYEFSKGFASRNKHIEWVKRRFPEVLSHVESRQQIERKGLWVNCGFYGQFNIDNSDSIPLQITQAVEDKLFEIPNKNRPEPGAITLLRRGISIDKPPLESVSLIAREIENYCVLAVATGQLDDKEKDRLIGYRYFWLDVRELNQGNSQNQPDGILTLLQWWFNNGQLCFNMNPDLCKPQVRELDKQQIIVRPKSLNAEDYN